MKSSINKFYHDEINIEYVDDLEMRLKHITQTIDVLKFKLEKEETDHNACLLYLAGLLDIKTKLKNKC